MDELLAAAVVGLSFGNSWLCVLFAFGARGESRTTSLYFMTGRIFGTIILGSIIALIGFAGSSSNLFVLLFGILSILFGIFVLRRDLIVERRKKCSRSEKINNHADGKSCLKHLGIKMGVSRNCRRKGFGISLGLFRGATPCLKIMILAPLLITSPLPLSLFMTLVFALTSSIYPLIGFIAGESLFRIRKFEFPIKAATVCALFIVGVYYIFKFLTSGSHQTIG